MPHFKSGDLVVLKSGGPTIKPYSRRHTSWSLAHGSAMVDHARRHYDGRVAGGKSIRRCAHCRPSDHQNAYENAQIPLEFRTKSTEQLPSVDG